MCGSGTIPIEAARLARRIAPGRDRSFAFSQWPEFRAETWNTLVEEARSGELPRSPVPIDGSDRDAGAIEAARANATRAGVADDIAFDTRPVFVYSMHDRARGSSRRIRRMACASAKAPDCATSTHALATCFAHVGPDGAWLCCPPIVSSSDSSGWSSKSASPRATAAYRCVSSSRLFHEQHSPASRMAIRGRAQRSVSCTG